MEPTVINVICPQCTKSWLNLQDERTYLCLSCNYVMLEKQVLEYVKQNRKDIHKVIYVR